MTGSVSKRKRKNRKNRTSEALTSQSGGKAALIIFTKNPVRGKVKTRLAESLGDEEALRIYNRLVAYTKRVATRTGYQIYVYYSENIITDDAWDDSDIVKREQRGRSLGERMLRALGEVLHQHPFAVIIGTDCGEILTTDIHEAVDALQYSDVVIGPASDGGYYLIGMSDLHAEIFSNVHWSTDQVFSQTIGNCLKAGVSFKLIATRSDVDTAEDWRALGWD